MKAGRPTYTTLQVGRGFAAIAVVMFHANTFFLPERLHPGQIAGTVFDMGYAGVEYFFVLSGFIMVLAHRDQFGQAGFLAAFLRKRFIRIMPFYWLVLLALIAMSLASGSLDGRFTPSNMFYSFLLVPKPDGSSLLITAAWTLSHEWLFYLVFSVLFVSTRLGIATFLVWMVAVLAVQLSGAPRYPFDFVLSAYNLLFLFGVIAALLFRKVPPGLAWLCGGIGVAGFFLVGLVDVFQLAQIPHAPRTVLFGLAAFLIVLGFPALETRGLISSNRFLMFLGDASYAIYLVHGIALALVSRIFAMSGLNAISTPVVSFVVIVTLAVALGSLAHRFVEKPLISYLRRAGRPRDRVPNI